MSSSFDTVAWAMLSRDSLKQSSSGSLPHLSFRSRCACLHASRPRALFGACGVRLSVSLRILGAYMATSQSNRTWAPAPVFSIERLAKTDATVTRCETHYTLGYPVGVGHGSIHRRGPFPSILTGVAISCKTNSSIRVHVIQECGFSISPGSLKDGRGFRWGRVLLSPRYVVLRDRCHPVFQSFWVSRVA